MYCRHCGAEVNAGSNFCNKCGTALRVAVHPREEPCMQQEEIKAPIDKTKNKTALYWPFIIIMSVVVFAGSCYGVSRVIIGTVATGENAKGVRTAVPGTDSVAQASDGASTGDVPFDASVQDFPSNGSVKRFIGGDAVAPLQIATSSGKVAYYYVKLVDYDSDQDVMAIYIHAGETADVKVPLGSYEIKYAVGNIWYGDGYLFGPKTEYAKTDRWLDFKRTGYVVTGYKVELIMQVNGNLSTHAISKEEF